MKNICALLIITGGLFVYDIPPEKASKPHHATEKGSVRRAFCVHSDVNNYNKPLTAMTSPFYRVEN